jgi:hypothetical protein
MHLRLVATCLLIAACKPEEGTTDASTTDDTDPGASTTPTSGDTPTTTDTPTTGAMPAECVGGGLGAAPAFTLDPLPAPGNASCMRISEDTLDLDCLGEFTGTFTLALANPGKLGLPVGEAVEVDYIVTKDGDDLVTGEWLRVRDQIHWYIVAGQGPTLAPPNPPADWFHPNVEVAVVATDCAALACSDDSGDEFTPRAISFGQGDIVNALASDKDGGVPGEFGGESHHAAVAEAQTGTCGGGMAGAAVDVLAFSVVSSGFL